jgi:hypothetical protein
MAITRSQLLAMNEEQLRRQVLIPLFQAMGFHDVVEYHGSGELGKDIVMWKAEGISRRVNYAVVAKATKLSGHAKGKGSAGEVSTQVLQCFGEDYTDPRTLEKQSVDRCIVVTNKAIKRETLTAIGSTLSTTFAKGRVDFMNGDELWQLVEQHLSLSAELQALAKAGKTLDSLSPNYRLTAQTGPDGIKLSAHAKHPDAAKAEPLNFNFLVSLPNTPGGAELREKLRKHIETGEGLTIPSDYIKDFTLPDILKPFAEGGKWNKVELGPRRRDEVLPVSIVLRLDGQPDLRLEDVELKATQAGTQELTLDNHHQKTPWTFSLKVNATNQAFTLNYTATAIESNVRVQLRAAKIQQYMAEGAAFILEDRTTGIEIIGARLKPGSIEVPQAEYIDLLEKLVLIQTKTRVPISLPNRDIEPEEIAYVYNLALAVDRGWVEVPFDSVSVGVSREGIPQMLEGPITGLVLAGIQTWSLFGVPIPAGRVVNTLGDLIVADPEMVRTQYQQNPTADEFDVTLVPPKGVKAMATVKYLAFLPKEEAKEWSEKLPDLPQIDGQ